MTSNEATKKVKAQSPVIPANPVASVENAPVAPFSIVGIGASAGGLEAFEQFFLNVPIDSGMAFVLVSHLDPSHVSFLTEILQRATAMPVVEVQDQMAVTPNVVYVIPPNRDMSIFHGVLQLSIPEEPRGIRMPIDAFLISLADDQGKRAIGIILSGTGTDGTLGLRAILGGGGVTLVQDPATAKYDGMPVSAIRAGCATHVLPAEKMLKVLLAGKRILVAPRETPPDSTAVSGMSRILMLLRSGTGHDFSFYKKSTIARRIERRMSQHCIVDFEIYARYLKENPAEVKLLFKELLINVTSFFRDAEAFVTLKRDILPLLFEGKPEGYIIRAWVVGCATGEETYSIAMLLREFMDETRQEMKIHIYSTDLDDASIAVARAGVYPPSIAKDMDPERLRRFFIKEDGNYRVKKDLREMVVFAVQNVIKDPPFTKLDLLSCRNVMIYLEPELQNRLIPIFHYALKPGGVLFLSPSESIGNHHELFAPLSRKWKFFRAIGTIASNRSTPTGGFVWTRSPIEKESAIMTIRTKETDLAELTKRALLQSFAPAAVVTDLNGNVLFVHSDTGKYLRPGPGQATLNVVDMARDGLQLDLRVLLSSVSQGESTMSREVSIKSNGDSHAVKISVQPMVYADAGSKLLLISFQDMALPALAKSGKRKAAVPRRAELQRIEDLEQELAYAKKNLQATIEDQQASNEELKSTNEELQSTNEELQSTNEELETSKEELQSVNEELITVNAELQFKIEQLFGMQSDMKNLIDNINGGTIFLDSNLKIKRYTRDSALIYRLVATDVGRSLCDIRSNIEDENLLAEAQAVLDSLTPQEHEVRTVGGIWYQVRIQPYRTLENVIDGVVLTFTDISKRVAAEVAEKLALKLAESIIDTVREPLLVLDENLKIIFASSSFYRDFQVSREDTMGRPIYSLGNKQWDIPKLRELLEKILPLNQSFDGYEVEHNFPDIGYQRMRLNARSIINKIGDTKMILLAIEKIS
jgi:two-component system CheB/CheR fusion protein